jgi:hypothetical protein
LSVDAQFIEVVVAFTACCSLGTVLSSCDCRTWWCNRNFCQQAKRIIEMNEIPDNEGYDSRFTVKIAKKSGTTRKQFNKFNKSIPTRSNPLAAVTRQHVRNDYNTFHPPKPHNKALNPHYTCLVTICSLIIINEEDYRWCKYVFYNTKVGFITGTCSF